MAISARRRGRPRSEKKLEAVSTRLEGVDHDRLVKIAAARRESVSEALRRIVTDVVRRHPTV